MEKNHIQIGWVIGLTSSLLNKMVSLVVLAGAKVANTTEKYITRVSRVCNFFFLND